MVKLRLLQRLGENAWESGCSEDLCYATARGSALWLAMADDQRTKFTQKKGIALRLPME